LSEHLLAVVQETMQPTPLTVVAQGRTSQ